MIMYHMMADTLGELFCMAKELGINSKHFQEKKNRPHFDICQSKKKLAIDSGKAIEISDKEMIIKFKEKYG